MKDIRKYQEAIFEKIKHHTGEGMEFWFARELQAVLEYTEWRNFNMVIHKAQTACANSGHDTGDHFVEVNKMVDLGSGAEREIDDIMLSRYACYMGSTELAANLFRATQPDEKLRRERIKGKSRANRTHYEVSSKVRQTIRELGGTMPEDLPNPEKSIQQIEREQKKITPQGR